MSGNSEVVTIRTLVEDKEMHQWKKFRELYTYKLFWCLGKPNREIICDKGFSAGTWSQGTLLILSNPGVLQFFLGVQGCFLGHTLTAPLQNIGKPVTLLRNGISRQMRALKCAIIALVGVEYKTNALFPSLIENIG